MSTDFIDNVNDNKFFNVILQKDIATTSAELTQSYSLLVSRKDGDKIKDVQHISMSSFDTNANKAFITASGQTSNNFLVGEEMSYFIISDGKTIKNFETAQDHKRVLEGDKGKNTGGMGAYSPSRLISEEIESKIISKIIKPTLKGLSELGTQYKGFLYAGLMIVNNEPFLIEYNVRMGDPECQTILPKLKTDLTEVLMACCNKNLDKLNLDWLNKKSLCIVVCSNGYPDEFKKNIKIENLKSVNLQSHDYLFHAGTSRKDEEVYATGGRVLNFVSISDDFNDAKISVQRNLDSLNWSGGFYRKDIGYKVIKE